MGKRSVKTGRTDGLAASQADGGQREPAGISGARDIALRAVEQARRQRCFVEQALETCLVRAAGPAEAGLARELAMGVIRHKLTLSCLVSAVLEGDIRRIDPVLQDVLFIGVYQLVWLGRVPSFAAVSQAVEQAKRIGGRKAGGLVNAVLRQLLRHRREQRCVFEQADPRRCVRVDHEHGCLFEIDLFDDPEAAPVKYYSLATSCPENLVNRWRRLFGPSRAGELCWAGQFRPPTCLRANCLRIEPGELARRLESEGLGIEYDAERGVVFLVGSPSIRGLSAFKEGLFQPQDPTAMGVVLRAGPQPGQKVLDLCAAPGTKATHMAELMADEGVVVACDVDGEKLARIERGARRLGISIVQTALPDQLAELRGRVGGFDLILVDAPCSNTGVLARRPEARYRFSAGRLRSLTALQGRLLDQAAGLAEKHTRIIYSTCSIEPEENEQAVQKFCERHSSWLLAESLLTLPEAAASRVACHDGGFVAELRRRV